MQQDIRYRDLPDWAKRHVQDFLGGRPRAAVVITGRAAIPANWCDWNVRRIVLRLDRHGATASTQKETLPACRDAAREVVLSDHGYEAAIDDALGVFFGLEGGTLPSGGAMLVIDSYPKRATLYVRQWNFPAALSPEVTDRERRILATYRAYKPSARGFYLRLGKVTPAEIETLVDKKMLSRGNALTHAGRLVCSQAEPFDWRDLEVAIA